MPGELVRGTEIGEAIVTLARKPEIRTYVEVGPLNGEGSTKCFLDAILARQDDSCLWSIEANIAHYAITTRFWQAEITRPRTWPKFILLYGRLIEPEELIPVEEIVRHPYFKAYNYPWLEWRERNVGEYRQCDNVIGRLPAKIDVLLLDGGQFSTWAEWLKLKARTTFILLDDTKTYKTERVRADVIADSEWTTIIDSPERQGIFVGCRKNAVGSGM
jgi:hypothetical protein